ncbi:Hypothetical protein, putative [Bodo saltans]|uniref:Ras-GAP domain-containing protein n=1 Tax=Bodo saltans TaxID=75058 RepID=A0A0S4KIQ6_BODSA|nr:Hypothetical protein, putative [Bodo saltans]|eukprot:CUI14407.1 Hypothetical protein, putative [Bodo saltans]
MENCIISCESPEFAKDALHELKRQSALWPFTFAWTCEVTIGKTTADTLLALGESDIRIFEASQASGGKTFQMFSEIAVSDASLKQHHGRECTIEYGIHQTFVALFPTPDILDRFVQCFMRSVGQAIAVRDGRSSSITSTNTTRSTMGDNNARATGKGSKLDDVLLQSTDTDYFHLGSNKAFCAKARNKWQKWTSRVRKKGQEEALFHVGETKASERGLARVLLSTDTQLGRDTHEVLVVTDVALFIVKRRDPSIIKVFLPIIGVESVQMASSTATNNNSNSGSLNDAVVEWTVMVILDLQIPVTTISTDVKLRVDSRNKNLFLSHLSRQYESLRLQRLPTMVLESTIFWRKRSFFEAKLMRIAGKIRSGIVRATSGAVEANKSEEVTAQNLREALVDHTESFVHALCKESIRRASPEDPEELGFIARSLLSTARRCGALQEVILAAISFETTRVFSLGAQQGSGSAPLTGLSRSELAGYFRSKTLVDFIVQEHCMHVGEQYLRVQLAQMIEEFVSSTSSSSNPSSEISDNECMRYVKELTSVLAESSHNDSLFPDALREIMMMIRAVHQGIDSGDRAMFSNWNPADDFISSFYIARAIESPQSHGLVSSELSGSQLKMLQLISRVFQRLASSHVNSSAVKAALADHPLHDYQSSHVKRICNSSQFQLFAPSGQSRVHEFMERLVADGHLKRDVTKLYERMSRPVTRSTARVARAPLLDSDVKVLHMMHGLLEKRAASVINATFTDETSLRSPRVASVRFRDPSFMSPRKLPEVAIPTPPAPLASKKVLEENADLRLRLGRLEQAMEQSKASLSKSAEAVKRLTMESFAKDEELSRLKRQLRESDKHYFPDVEEFTNTPMLQESAAAGSVYAYYCREIHSPRRVFACPLDSYTVRGLNEFSPRD